MAAKSTFSKVIVCTDGLSNIGVGALSPESLPLEREFARGLYQRLGSAAVETGGCLFYFAAVTPIDGFWAALWP